MKQDAKLKPTKPVADSAADAALSQLDEARTHGAIQAVNAYHLRLINAARDRLGQPELAVPLLARWLSGVAIGTDAAAHRARDILLDLDLPRIHHGPHPSRRSLAPVLGVPRETLRRQAQRLDAVLDQDPAAGDALSHAPGEELSDFLATAAWVRELHAVPERAINWQELHRTTRACRREDLPARPLPTPASSARARAAQSEQAVIFAGYKLRALMRLQARFEHDLRLPMILGEIAHFCTHSLSRDAVVSASTARSLFVLAGYDALRESGALRSCGAHSLALAMNLPTETLRRKLLILQSRGWITRDADGMLWVERADVRDDFIHLLQAQRDDLLSTAALIAEVEPRAPRGT